MPIIAMFYGIIIRMFYRDNQQHHLAHVHAEYQGQVAVFSIMDGVLVYRVFKSPILSVGTDGTQVLSQGSG